MDVKNIPAQRKRDREKNRATKKAGWICVNRHAGPLLCSGGDLQEWENMALYNMIAWGL